MNPHLTDDLLQDFLDGKVATSAPATISHLKNCTHCQSRLLQYQRLFAELNQEPELDYPADFSAQIIAKLPLLKPTFNWNDWLIPILGLAGTATGALAMVYLGKIQVSFLLVTILYQNGRQLVHYLFHFGDYLKENLHLNFFLLGLATLTILFTAVLDHWIHRRLLVKMKPYTSKY